MPPPFRGLPMIDSAIRRTSTPLPILIDAVLNVDER
jgi:hypothetical protein